MNALAARAYPYIKKKWSGVWIATLLASSAMMLTLRPSIALIDGVSGYHIHPIKYLESTLASAWSANVQFGADNGASLLTVMPNAVLYALLHALHVSPSLSQHIIFFLLFMTSGLSMGWFATILGRVISSTRPVAPVAAIAYVVNLYVCYTMLGNSPMLWPYAFFPFTLGFAALAIRAERPIYFAALVGLLSVVTSGPNPTIMIINVLFACGFSVFVAATSRNRLTAFKLLGRFIVIALFICLAVNTFWVFPFIYHAKTAWLGGIFSEASTWHSSLSSVANIMRFISGEGFFGAAPGIGSFYPYSFAYRGITLFSLLTIFIPAFALSTALWRRGWGEPVIRFFVFMSLLILPLASGDHEGSWFANAYHFFYNHIPFFQIFRETEKWDSILALSFAILIAYNTRFVLGLLPKTALLWRHIVAALISTIPIIAILPVIQAGAFRASAQISGLPSYWQSTGKLKLPKHQRTLLFPEAYLPRYFWGEVQPDFPGWALQAPVVYNIANGSGAPTYETASYTLALYRGLASASNWVPSLLSRLSISDLLEQRDEYYPPSDVTRSPNVQVSKLAQFSRSTPADIYGDFTVVRLRRGLPILATYHPFFSTYHGTGLIKLFPFLSPSEAIVSGAPSSQSRNTIPIIYESGTGEGLFPAVAEVAPSIYKATWTGNPIFFRVPSGANVRIFIRPVSGSPQPLPFVATVDSSLTSPSVIRNGWTQVAAFYATSGIHTLSFDQALPPLQVRIFNAAEFEKTGEAITNKDLLIPWISVGRRATRFVAFQSQRYVFRIRRTPDIYEQFRFPLGVSANPNLGAQISAACLALPLAPSHGVAIDSEAPPRSWYFDSTLLKATRLGRMNTFWGDTSLNYYILNPFQSNVQATIQMRAVGVGAARSLRYSTGDHYRPLGVAHLNLPPSLNLDRLESSSFLGLRNYLSLSGPPSLIRIREPLAPGWNTLNIETSDTDGLPSLANPFDGFTAFGVLGTPNASGCLKSQPSSLATFRPRVSGNRRTKLIISAFSLHVPKVPLSTFPSLSLRIAPAYLALRVSALIQTSDSKGLDYSFSVPAYWNGRRHISFTLTPVRTVTHLTSRITRITLFISHKLNDKVTVSDARLTLARTVVTRSTSRSRSTNDSSNISVQLPRHGSAAIPTRVLLTLEAPPHHAGWFEARRSGEWLLGRSMRLAVRSERIFDSSFAIVSLEVPKALKKMLTIRNVFRGRVFVGNRAIRLRRRPRMLPYYGSIHSSKIVALVPLKNALTKSWTAVFVPRKWYLPSNRSSRVIRVSVPAEDGMTTIKGQPGPVRTRLRFTFHSLERVSSSDRTDFHTTAQYVFATLNTDKPKAPVLSVNGTRLRVTKSPYGWWQGAAYLVKGSSWLTTSSNTRLTILAIPGSIEETMSPPPLLGRLHTNATGSFSSKVKATTTKPSAPLVLGLREAFNPGWRATGPGVGATHFKLDGFANAFALRPSAGTVSVYYCPAFLLYFSELISAISLAALSFYLCGFFRLENTPNRYLRNPASGTELTERPVFDKLRLGFTIPVVLLSIALIASLLNERSQSEFLGQAGAYVGLIIVTLSCLFVNRNDY